jgi:acetyl-CoA synthetase
MTEQIYDVPPEWSKRAFIDEAKYEAMYARSVKDPNGFWGEQAKRIDWLKPFTKVKNTSFDPHHVSIKWFEDGVTNVAHNCIDRHLAKRGDQVAIIWEGDDPKDDRKISYRELYGEVCRFANVLKSRGVKKGDRVTIYLPMIPEAASRMPRPPSSSPPMKACAAAARCRSRRMPMSPPIAPAMSRPWWWCAAPALP